MPPIPGLRDVPYVTNKTLFNLTELPPRMVVVGAGPIGIEMAQTFALFGTHVTVLDIGEHILAREDVDAARIVEEAIVADGVHLCMGVKNMSFSHVPAQSGFSIITASFELPDGSSSSLECETLLVATGRQPNVEGLGLDVAGIEYDARFGIPVDDLMVTSNPNVYAIGDCSSKWQFTHMAGTQAMMVVENSQFEGQRKVSELVIPRCTYTSPEVAGTGMSEHDITEQGLEFDTYTSQLAHVDRAILESGDSGFCKILAKKDTGEILGATIVAENAGDIISELTLAIQSGVDLAAIGRTIHPYPTVAEAIAGCAHQYKVKNWKTKAQ